MYQSGCLYYLGRDWDWEWEIKRFKIKQTEIEYNSLVGATDDSILWIEEYGPFNSVKPEVIKDINKKELLFLYVSVKDNSFIIFFEFVKVE